MTSFSAKRVLFVTFPKLKLLDLTGPVQVFTDANLQGQALYDVRVASLKGGTVKTDTVMPATSERLSLFRDEPIDTLVIVGGPGAYGAAKDDTLLEEVRTLSAKARRVASVCTGAFVLAAANLLAQRSAVTHWESCERLQTEHPEINVKADAIFVRDGKFRTSAGVTAGIDMCLDMVAEDLGRPAALALARSLVCYLIRPGGQSQFSAPLQQQAQSSTDKFDRLNAWISENLSADLSVEALAEREGMSPRNFSRLYRQHTGTTPAKAVEALRVDAACRMLEESQLPLTVIAVQCGFYDDERFRRAMMRGRGVAPGEYRQRFSTLRASA
ncbi:MAG: helix-turn-helix domain-containing protein [Pseudomonadota bacterium]